jgi:hypothetical protein
MLRRLVLASLVLLSSAPAVRAVAEPPPDLARWEPDIRAFEEADRVHPPVRGGILFAGSSSIRLWTRLAEDFPELPVINRGFGGSQVREVTAFVPRIVLPYRPSLIVFYCGTNDIASGSRTAVEVAEDVREFVQTVRKALPDTRVAFISAAPKELLIDITSPVAFICVPRVLSAFTNLSKGHFGIFTTT